MERNPKRHLKSKVMDEKGECNSSKIETKLDKRSHTKEYSLTKMSDGDIMKLLVDKSDSEDSSIDSDLGEWAVSKTPRKKLALSEKNGPNVTLSADLFRGSLEGIVSPIKIKRRIDLNKEHNSKEHTDNVLLDKGSEQKIRKWTEQAREEPSKSCKRTELKGRSLVSIHRPEGTTSRKSLRVDKLPRSHVFNNKSTRNNSLSLSSDVSDDDGIIKSLKGNIKSSQIEKGKCTKLVNRSPSKSKIDKKSLNGNLSCGKQIFASTDITLRTEDLPSSDFDSSDNEDLESFKENIKNILRNKNELTSINREISSDDEYFKENFKNTPQKQKSNIYKSVSITNKKSLKGISSSGKISMKQDNPSRNVGVSSSESDTSDDVESDNALKTNLKNTPQKQTPTKKYATRRGDSLNGKKDEVVDGVRHSPRITKNITNYCEISPEKKVSSPRGFNSPRSTRSTKPLIESPLAKDNSPRVKGEEKVHLHNRMSLKRTLNDEICLTSPASRRSIQSPRTPLLSLRKQVLEATTPVSAKKKLYLEEDEEAEKEEKVVGKRQSRNSTPVKRTPSKGTDSPKRTPKKYTPSKGNQVKGAESNPGTPTGVRLVGQGFLTPVVQERSKKVSKMSSLETLRLKLHVSTVPSSLPCREQEFANIKSFVSTKICDSSGGCMYISGVPGTGKTATVHAVIKCLQQDAIDGDISAFDFVEVNGLRLTDARQAYVRIWQSLSGNKLSPDQALRFLEKKFSSKPRRSTVLLVDELDYVCNKRQDVVYNILDWPSKQNSKLVILTIANTMDLPERTLKGKVTSRMGLTRLVFQPYTYKQLQEIVMERLSGSSCFHVDAVQLVSRKVAAVSGDARRALDICRRATEMLEESDSIVSVDHVEKALTQIFSGTRVLAIRNTTYMGQLVLRSIRDETQRTGIEETNVKRVYSHLRSLCPLEGSQVPTVGQVLFICRALNASGLITAEQGRHDINTKLSLNVSSDDIHYALTC